MKKSISLAVLFLLVVLDAFPQKWESIRDNHQDYIHGEGWGATIEEADKNALADLVGKIKVDVKSEFYRTMTGTTENGEVHNSSNFSSSVNTKSQAILTNTKRVVLQKEPEAYVARWIEMAEINRIYDARTAKARDLVEAAIKAEEKGKIDDVLQNYYWALALLNSLQYPNEVMHTDENGKSRILTHWIEEQINETLDNLKVNFTKWDGNNANLFITYKGKPVNSVDYTYFDGRIWSNIYSAKDGYGTLELAHGAQQAQLRFEYEYAGQARKDKEVEAVLNAVKETPMRKAEIIVKLDKAAMGKQKLEGESFSQTSLDILAAPKDMGKDANVYMKLTEKVLKAVEKKNMTGLEENFTTEGWDMFKKLIEYGKARVLDSENIKFYEYNGAVIERGLKMSFSFASNVRKSFVEDVVLTFNDDKKICNIAFGLGKTAEDDILNKGIWDETSRLAIMSFLENYKTAYALKRLDYVESVFDDDAIIITATVLNKATSAMTLENQPQLSLNNNQIIKHNRQTKDEYLKNLQKCFERNEFINIRFSDNEVKKLGVGGESYAIQIAQDYYSSTYGDKGYLMLMVNMNDPEKPLIYLRTWQPEKDPDFGIYGPEHF